MMVMFFMALEWTQICHISWVPKGLMSNKVLSSPNIPIPKQLLDFSLKLFRLTKIG